MDMLFRSPYVSSRALVSNIGVSMPTANKVLMKESEFRVTIVGL